MGGNHNHQPDWITVSPFESHILESYESQGHTIIKSDAWIGMRAMIMPGLTIHEGAIIAAGSVVVKDIEPYTVVGGNPAQLIKKRFKDEEIEMFLEMKWWDWPQSHIDEAKDYLMSNQIKALYTYYKDHVCDIL